MQLVKDKIGSLLFNTMLLVLAMCIQAGMILCDVIERVASIRNKN